MKEIDEIIGRLAYDIEMTCRRLLQSGAIDREQFKDKKNVLAKLLVSAALNQHKDDLLPNGYRAEMENLLKF